jgi:hypothetical protein
VDDAVPDAVTDRANARQRGSDRSVATAANTADVVAVDVEARHPVAIAVTAIIIAIMIEAVVIGAAAPALAIMEAMLIMEAVLSMEVTGFGRRRGGGDAAGCDKRGEGEGDNSGLDRHEKTPSGSGRGRLARMLIGLSFSPLP